MKKKLLGFFAAAVMTISSVCFGIIGSCAENIKGDLNDDGIIGFKYRQIITDFLVKRCSFI